MNFFYFQPLFWRHDSKSYLITLWNGHSRTWIEFHNRFFGIHKAFFIFNHYFLLLWNRHFGSYFLLLWDTYSKSYFLMLWNTYFRIYFLILWNTYFGRQKLLLTAMEHLFQKMKAIFYYYRTLIPKMIFTVMKHLFWKHIIWKG